MSPLSAEIRRWPAVAARQSLPDGGLRLRLWLEPDLVWFAGHFPEAPLLPGVAQLHIALHLATTELGLQGEFAGMEVIKFQQPLRPGQHVELDLCWEPTRQRLLFTYRLDEAQASSGRVRLC